MENCEICGEKTNHKTEYGQIICPNCEEENVQCFLCKMYTEEYEEIEFDVVCEDCVDSCSDTGRCDSCGYLYWADGNCPCEEETEETDE